MFPRCIVPSNRHHWNIPPTFKNWQLNCPLKTVILFFLVSLFRRTFTEENEFTRVPSVSPLPFPVRRFPSPSRSIHWGQGPTSGKRLTSLHYETRGREKIRRLLLVHCSGSFHVHYMNVVLQLVNWWRVALARFWHVCLEQNGRTWRSHIFFTMLLEKVLCLLPNVPEIKEKQKKCLNLLLAALFKNARILEFKSQLTFAFFAAADLVVAWISSDYFESLLLPHAEGVITTRGNRMKFRLTS